MATGANTTPLGNPRLAGPRPTMPLPSIVTSGGIGGGSLLRPSYITAAGGPPPQTLQERNPSLVAQTQPPQPQQGFGTFGAPPPNYYEQYQQSQQTQQGNGGYEGQYQYEEEQYAIPAGVGPADIGALAGGKFPSNQSMFQNTETSEYNMSNIAGGGEDGEKKDRKRSRSRDRKKRDRSRSRDHRRRSRSRSRDRRRDRYRRSRSRERERDRDRRDRSRDRRRSRSRDRDRESRNMWENPNSNSVNNENSQDSQTARQRKKKSRWGGGEMEKVFIPGMPTILPGNMTTEQERAYLIQLQIEELSRRLRTDDLGIPQNPEERSPSPEPIYNQQGKRLNTREFRVRKKLEDERHALVQEMVAINPDFKPPADYKPPSIRISEKVMIPQEQYPDINFVGLLLGPRGNTLRNLEKETGAKIAIRGKGSTREGKVGKDGQPHPGEDEPLHALCSGLTTDIVIKAVKKISQIIKEVIETPEGQNDLRRNQLRELALLNGTLREGDDAFMRCNNCGATTHKSWQCPDKPNVTNNVICTACGGAGHIARDCRNKTPGMTWKAPGGPNAKIDQEYMSLMAELGEGPAPDEGAGGGQRNFGGPGVLGGRGGPTRAIAAGGPSDRAEDTSGTNAPQNNNNNGGGGGGGWAPMGRGGGDGGGGWRGGRGGGGFRGGWTSPGQGRGGWNNRGRGGPPRGPPGGRGDGSMSEMPPWGPGGMSGPMGGMMPPWGQGPPPGMFPPPWMCGGPPMCPPPGAPGAAEPQESYGIDFASLLSAPPPPPPPS